MPYQQFTLLKFNNTWNLKIYNKKVDASSWIIPQIPKNHKDDGHHRQPPEVFTGKHLCHSLFFNKVASCGLWIASVFLWILRYFFNNIFLREHLRAINSEKVLFFLMNKYSFKFSNKNTRTMSMYVAVVSLLILC